MLLAVALAAAGYARTALSPLQEAMRVALGLSDNQMALLQGPAMSLPLVALAIPLGMLVDRYSRVRLLLVLMVVNLGGSILTVLATKFGLLFLARALVGFAGFATFPIVMSLLADLYGPEHRGRVTMAVSIGQIGGNSAAFALGGALLVMAGSDADAWRSALFWLSTPLMLVVLLTLALREPPRIGMVVANPSAREIAAELWQYRARLGPLLVGFIMAEIALGAVLIWATPTLARNFGLSPDRIGAIMGTVFLVSGLSGPVVGGTLADICQRTGGPRRTVAVLSVLALVGVPAGLAGVLPSVALASALLAVFMTLALAVAVMAMALFTIVIPNELRGLCMSMLVATNIFFAVGVAPPAVSVLSGVLGGPAMIGTALTVLCVSTSLIGAAAFALGRRGFAQKI